MPGLSEAGANAARELIGFPPASRSDGGPSLRVQIWSYNYDPEPTGIGPVSRVLAEGLRDRGHSVEVVAAHPHYPVARWGVCRLPYRELRNGIPVLRLPLWVGRANTTERYRQELTYMSSQFATLPVLGRPDVVVSASPSFPALLPALINAKVRRVPWLLWLQDILPDGALSTGLVDEGVVTYLARHLERATYRHADQIVVLSEAFTANLIRKGVPEHKIKVLRNPATRTPQDGSRLSNGAGSRPLRILSMGNIGYSQGLAPLVRAFDRSRAMRDHDVRLVITGEGVASDEVRREIGSERVEMLGLVDDRRLEAELKHADIALVSQQHAGTEFNIPSKLMNFMAYGLPLLAAVSSHREVARIVDEADGGWVVDTTQPERFPEKIAELLANPREITDRGAAAAAYADRHFTQSGYAERFEATIRGTIARAAGAGRSASPGAGTWS